MIKKQTRPLLSLAILFISVLNTFAQKNNFSVTPSIGITTPVLDNGVGVLIGLNAAYRVSSFFSWEGQVSYLGTRVSSSFLTGKKGAEHATNVLAGGRLYLVPARRETRVYYNLLLGLNHAREKVANEPSRSELGGGISTGLYVEKKRLVLGLSYETPQNAVIRVGYSL